MKDLIFVDFANCSNLLYLCGVAAGETSSGSGSGKSSGSSSSSTLLISDILYQTSNTVSYEGEAAVKYLIKCDDEFLILFHGATGKISLLKDGSSVIQSIDYEAGEGLIPLCCGRKDSIIYITYSNGFILVCTIFVWDRVQIHSFISLFFEYRFWILISKVLRASEMSLATVPVRER